MVAMGKQNIFGHIYYGLFYWLCWCIASYSRILLGLCQIPYKILLCIRGFGNVQTRETAEIRLTYSDEGQFVIYNWQLDFNIEVDLAFKEHYEY